MRDLFVEVVVAPRISAEAQTVFAAKKNIRVIEVPRPDDAPSWDFKRVRGGFLVQDRFRYGGVAEEAQWKVVTRRSPTPAEWDDLRFAWAAVGAVKSNAILLARDGRALGIGAGQMSRVDASFLAVHKARHAGHDPAGAVLASDAFFPFRDGVDEAAAAGVRAVIQPGGSVRDTDVIQAADEHGMTMVMTGVRQFRH
jgi:phosphoribosylaminoimidazolecarboxamide formyltransferase/IMP cyclohydrolase